MAVLKTTSPTVSPSAPIDLPRKFDHLQVLVWLFEAKVCSKSG